MHEYTQTQTQTRTQIFRHLDTQTHLYSNTHPPTHTLSSLFQCCSSLYLTRTRTLTRASLVSKFNIKHVVSVCCLPVLV